MSARDFAVFNSPLGAHVRAHYARANDNAFRAGEPVFIDADGDLDGCADAPTTIAGIALEPVGSGNGFGNYRTGAAYAAGDLVSFIAATSDTLFVTAAGRFATDGAGTAATPTRTNIGDLCGVSLAGGNYFLDSGEANKVAIVVDVLDSLGRSLQDSTAGTGSRVVFKFGPFLAGVNIQFQGIA